jgi:uncharacterized protein
MDNYINKLDYILKNSNVCKSHGIEHAITVYENAKKALDSEIYGINEDEIHCVLLAALLHDADDRKFFPNNNNHENVKQILFGEDLTTINLVTTMIDLVSSSKNGDSIPDYVKDKHWMLIPRYADRLEALGMIGIERCWQYGKTTNNPLFVETTPVAQTEEEIWNFATIERYNLYKGKSNSMIDHFYDKLLRASIFPVKNKFFEKETKNRRKYLIDFLLYFAKTSEMSGKKSLTDKDVIDFLKG